MLGKTVVKYTNDARLVYAALNSIFVLYKPAHLSFNEMRDTVIKNLCRDLNDLHVRPPMKHIRIEGKTNSNMRVIVQNSFADHPLVVGPRYQPNDFRLAASKILHQHISGVVVCGINKGNKLIHQIKTSKCIRFYKVKGLLGQATDNYFHTGRVVEKSTYAHVRRGHIDKLCSSMQSSHQRKMFELSGVDIQSQAAYKLAIKGPIRPADPKLPMVYAIKCVHFSPPEFELEIVCVNEYDMYLKTIIHELGMKLRSTATCTEILCTQDGLFNLQHALLQKQWNLNEILQSIQICRPILIKNKNILHQTNPALMEPANDSAKISTVEQLH